MKNLILVAIAASALISSVSVAQQRRTTVTRSSSTTTYMGGESEVQVGVIGNGKLTSQKPKDGSTTTVIDARGSYAFHLQDQIQVGGEVGFFSTSGGTTSASYVELLGFGTFNFDPNIAESFYVKGGAGLFGVPKVNGEYENKFGLFAGVGARFPMWGSLAYNPEARLLKKGDLDISFEIIFLQASVMF
jgi:hypothetical protein